MSNLRWRKNDTGGLTLQMHVPEKTHIRNNHIGSWSYKAPAYWAGVADVYKAKKGERWIVRVMYPKTRGFHQYAAFTLREAMRMAKLLVGIRHV